jgi:hypothetical protein
MYLRYSILILYYHNKYELTDAGSEWTAEEESDSTGSLKDFVVPDDVEVFDESQQPDVRRVYQCSKALHDVLHCNTSSQTSHGLLASLDALKSAMQEVQSRINIVESELG